MVRVGLVGLICLAFCSCNRLATPLEFAESQLGVQEGSPSIWRYLLAALIVSVTMLRRRSATCVVIGTFALSALTYQLTLLVGLMGANYRYEFPSLVVCEISIAMALYPARSRKGRGGDRFDCPVAQYRHARSGLRDLLGDQPQHDRRNRGHHCQ